MIQVLVVDDDFMVARLHSSVVASQPGFEVIGAARTGRTHWPPYGLFGLIWFCWISICRT